MPSKHEPHWRDKMPLPNPTKALSHNSAKIYYNNELPCKAMPNFHHTYPLFYALKETY